jgi:hypothetical protein
MFRSAFSAVVLVLLTGIAMRQRPDSTDDGNSEIYQPFFE